MYSYEIKKSNLEKRNKEDQQFINFVSRYNEEILEINKKHILVSSLLNIGKKAEILLKPSLCLKKILPKDLQSMEYKIEKAKRDRKKDSIFKIGQILLELYHRGLERQKMEKMEKEKTDKIETNTKKEKTKNKITKNSIKPPLIKVEHSNKLKNKTNINNFIDLKKKGDIRNQLKGRNENTYFSPKKEPQMILTKKLTLSHFKKAMHNYYLAHMDSIEKNKTKKHDITKDFNNESNIRNKSFKNFFYDERKKNKTKEKKETLTNFRINNSKIKKLKKEEKVQKMSIISLVDKYFEDIKSITDKDFCIFEFKKKVGYKNVLPIMSHVILKSLGLFDSKIICKKKIDSFLYAVNDGYKESTLYHNSLHGADITQSLCMFFISSNVEEVCQTTVLDLLGMIIAAMGHDLGHPGFNT